MKYKRKNVKRISILPPSALVYTSPINKNHRIGGSEEKFQSLDRQIFPDPFLGCPGDLDIAHLAAT